MSAAESTPPRGCSRHRNWQSAPQAELLSAGRADLHQRTLETLLPLPQAPTGAAPPHCGPAPRLPLPGTHHSSPAAPPPAAFPPSAGDPAPSSQPQSNTVHPTPTAPHPVLVFTVTRPARGTFLEPECTGASSLSAALQHLHSAP